MAQSSKDPARSMRIDDARWSRYRQAATAAGYDSLSEWIRITLDREVRRQLKVTVKRMNPVDDEKFEDRQDEIRKRLRGD